MDRSRTRLFHLHFNTPDVPAAESALVERGFPLQRRFGRLDGDSASFGPNEPVPDGFRLRLETLQRGYVNVTLAPGRAPRFDHLGLCTAAFDAVLERAREAGWSVRGGADARRTFVMTPWEFRVEVHPDGGDVESSLGAWSEAHLSDVRLAVPEPDSVREELTAVFGTVPGLVVEQGERERAWVSSFRVEGEAFPDGANLDAAATLG